MPGKADKSQKEDKQKSSSRGELTIEVGAKLKLTAEGIISQLPVSRDLIGVLWKRVVKFVIGLLVILGSYVAHQVPNPKVVQIMSHLL